MKRTYILIFSLVFIIIIIGIVLASILPSRNTSIHVLLSPTPISNRTQIVTGTILPTMHITSTNNDEAFQSSIDNKKTLSSTDENAKETLINSLGQDQETLYQTQDFTITYIRYYDMFQVAVNTTNISQAERDAIAWFASKGLSKDAVCKIPVQFYPSFELNQQLIQQGIQMPPLAEGC